MTKNEFLELAAKLYDQAFPNNEGNLFEGGTSEAEKEQEAKVLIGAYKARNEFVKLSDYAYHYKQPFTAMEKVVSEVGVVPVKGSRGMQMLSRADVEFLNSYIARRYNNFNE